MQRIAFLVFLLTASLAGAESRPFAFNLEADAEFSGYSNDLETNVGGVLNDTRTSMGFLGGHVFADISEYVTVSAGVFYGLTDANLASDGGARIRDTAANAVLLLDLSAVVKYPIVVDRTFSFAPKVGFDSLTYLLGTLDGESPDAESKTSLSPFSFIVGADLDYTFPSGLFLRLPVEGTYALNSRPSSVSGKYIASNTITFRTGLGVGYKLAGFDRSEQPASNAAAAAAKTEDKGTEPSRPAIRLAGGAGTSLLTYVASQTMSGGFDGEFRQTLGFTGLYAFFDVSDYFTAYTGALFGIGDATQSVTGFSDATAPNRLVSWEFGAEVKYPFPLSDQLSVAPKLGIVDVIYVAGKADSDAPDSNGKQIYSPLLLTVGADGNFSIDEHWFVRVPVELGWALNTKLADSFYSESGAKYASSYTLSFRLGLSVGYKL